MTSNIQMAILVEKNATLRKEITRQVKVLGAKKTIGCAIPTTARRAVVATNKPGLLVIGNSDNLESCYNLIGFCRDRVANWTIIALDHINSEDSARDAFASGADDVLHVPFSSAEFHARLKLRLKQSTKVQPKETELVESIFEDTHLTNTELEIMNYLVTNKGKTVTRNELARHFDDRDWVYGDRKYDVHITNIRKKLKKKPEAKYTVKSVRSVGYYIQDSSG